MSSKQFPPPPLFGVFGGTQTANQTNALSIVDIFDEFLFSNEQIIGNNSTSNLNYDDDFDSVEGDETEEGKKRKKTRGLQRNMTEDQKTERRLLIKINNN
jgi:hypothetical protein